MTQYAAYPRRGPYLGRVCTSQQQGMQNLGDKKTSSGRHPQPAAFPVIQGYRFLQTIARLIPLTYLADALRQVMVGGAAFAPLYVCAAVLVAWLVGCFFVASRTFRWQ